MSEVSATVLAESGDAVAVGLRWREAGRDKPREWFQVLRIAQGRVVDMQDFERRGPALRAVAAAR